MGSARGSAPLLDRRHRRYRFRPWPTRAELEEESHCSRTMPMHHLDDLMAYRNFIQMPPELCQELEQRIIDKFVSEVCDAMTRAYQDQVMQCPTLPEDWLLVESVFRWKWNFPHALGVLDGRHIPIRCPQGRGSLFLFCKGFHSIVFLALVDGDSKFLWVDMGAAGSNSDGHIFKHTNLRHNIEDSSIGFPDSESLGIGGPKVNFFMFGDDAFPLKLWLMMPYSSRTMDLKEMVFNYRIRRGRTVVQDAFGC